MLLPIVLLSLGVLTLFCVVIIGVLLLERTKNNYSIINRLDSIEMMCSNIMSDTLTPPNSHGMFRSIDGKYSAESLDELLMKMQGDSDGSSPTLDAEGLRQMFENLTGDDDDDDDEDKPWEKK